MVHTKFFKAVLLFGVLAAFLASATTPAAAQGTGTIRGVVTQAGTETPIVGVQIHVLGTRLTAVTDENGAYQLLNVPVGNVDLRVRMIGYSRASANANLTASLPLELNFEMRQSVIALEAVVVTGAGAAVEKKQLGNTVATLDMNQIETAPVQNFSEVLAAREPSVTLSTGSGISGAGASIRIRGASSLSMSNEPVVYVDGVRVDNGTGFQNNAATPSRLDDISPDAIERVEILKGAAAATLYGSEASAGVIQIFTKRGSAGAPRFSFRVEQGISNYPDVYKPNSGFARDQAQADRINEVYGQTPGWTNVAPFEVFERTFMKDIFETGHQQTYSANVSGGGEAVHYFVSGRFNRDDGPLGREEWGPARDVTRNIQGVANVTIFPRERLSFRVGTMYSDAMNSTPENGNNIYGTYALAQFGKPERAMCEDQDGDGRMDVLPGSIGNTIPICAGPGNETGNAAFMTVQESFVAENVQDFEHFNGNLTASYQAAGRLNFEATFGIDVTNGKQFWFRYFDNSLDGLVSDNTEGDRTIRRRHHRELTVDIKGIWDQSFGPFTSQFTSGVQGFVSTNTTAFSTGDKFPGPGIETVGAAANKNTGENWLQVVNTGWFAQEQIGYNDYAYLTLGARWDRNSAFGENTGGALYPKVSFSVIPSDMPGWDNTLLSTIRVRGAIGKSGLQPGAFDKFTTYQSGVTTLGSGLRPANLGNQDLEPEKSTEIEAGAEFGLFNNIMGLEATYWHRKTTDALVDMQFPLSGGFSNFQRVNIGELVGQGVELKFDWLTLDNENVSVTMFAAASYIKEQIRSMGTAPPIKLYGSYTRIRNYLMPPWDTDGDGEPDRFFAPGSYFGGALIDYEPGSTVPFDVDNNGVADTEAAFRAWLSSDTDGISLSQTEMMPLLRDDDGDGDDLDTYLGKPDPDWTGSFGTQITLWNRLDISSLLEFRTGNYGVSNLTDAFRNAHGLIGLNTPDAAQVEATMANPASTEDEKFDAAMEWATRLRGLAPTSGLNQIRNGRFLALREVSLTYRAPANLASKLGLDNLAFTLSGRNIHKWHGYDGIDPESNDAARIVGTGMDNNFAYGNDSFGTPMPRRFSFAVQFGF